MWKNSPEKNNKGRYFAANNLNSTKIFGSMKAVFIECRYKGKLAKAGFSKLPRHIGLCGTVQYLDFLPQIEKELKKAGKTVKYLKGHNVRNPGQVLGCSNVKIEGVDAILYVGDGMFHPINLKIQFDGSVFCFHPESGALQHVNPTEVESYKKRQQGAYMKFLTSDTIGVLISTKHGQSWKHFTKLEKKFPRKAFYYLAFDNIDYNQLMNFPFCEYFVNTACPRIGIEDALVHKLPIINIQEIL